MKWNRIVLKLGGTIIVLFLVVLLPLGFIINQIFSGFYYNEVEQEIDRLSTRYANTITSLKDPQILNMFETLANLTNNEIYIVNAKGEVAANSGVSGLAEEGTIPLRELKQLANGERIQKKYLEPNSERKLLVSGAPIIRNGTFYGGVFVLSSIDGIARSLQKVHYLLILSGVGALFLAAGFTFILSRKLSDPLIQMERAARKMAKGNLNTRVNVNSNDEIGSLAQAINDLAVELNRYRTNRSEFFANVSHELRTPITYLEGYANVLKKKLYQTEEEKQQYLAIILQESKRLTRLVKSLSELSKMEEGKIDLDLQRLDLVEVLENALLKTELRAKEKHLQINKEIESDLPPVYGDGLRMEQIMINLLENAIRYTEKGSITLAARLECKNVKIIISDTGIGIPEKELPHIFDRFHRVEKSRSREYGGSGLGLAIVKHLIELQGGTIDALSIVGKGSSFQITFPVASEEGGET